MNKISNKMWIVGIEILVLITVFGLNPMAIFSFKFWIIIALLAAHSYFSRIGHQNAEK